MARTEALPRVERGSVEVLRLYDVAYAIDLARVEEIGAMQSPTTVARIRLTRAKPKAIAFGTPPVEIALGPVRLPFADGERVAQASARIYDFGVVSIALRIAANGLSWEDYAARVRAAGEVAGTEAGSAVWTELVARVRNFIAPAIERPTPPGLEEDYILAVVNALEPALTAEELLERVDIAALLSGESQPLSASARRDLLRYSFSYFRNDLAVVTWDSAFLLEPGGDTDVADVLEVANAQLLELRYYDELLDSELPRMYDRVAQAHRALRGLSLRRYARLARDLHTLVADITEVTEKVDNALKVTEDVYLARIYAAALELFRVRAWSGDIDRKLGIIRDTYQTLYDEAATARAEILEATIVLLIVLEIVLAWVV